MICLFFNSSRHLFDKCIYKINFLLSLVIEEQRHDMVEYRTEITYKLLAINQQYYFCTSYGMNLGVIVNTICMQPFLSVAINNVQIRVHHGPSSFK